MINRNGNITWEKKDRFKYRREYLIFFTGILAGLLLVIIPGGRRTLSIMNEEIKSLFTSFLMEVEYTGFLKYLLIRRLLAFGIFASFSLLWICRYVVNVSFFVYGFMTGNLLILLLLEYGIKGLLYFLALLMPQGLFYLYAYIRLGRTVCKINSIIIEKNNRRYASVLNETGLLLTELVSEFGVTIIGIFTECYVNLRIIKIIVNIL